MCNRFSFHTSPKELADRLNVVSWLVTPEVNYNVAPTSTVPVVRLQDGERVLDGLCWGLVPFWAKDLSIGTKALNARAETAAEKPMFRAAFKSRRCLVLASGYYEWQKTLTGKQPYHIHLPEYEPFAFAGLWEECNGPDGLLRTCTILTTEPNEQLAPIHNRMPVILPRDQEAVWLDPALTREKVQALLQPFPVGELIANPVGSRVGKVDYKDPDCITPLVGT